MKPLALVVENDGGTRKLLDVLLGRFGLEVDAVAHGADALLLLEHVTYDVLFLDLLLPGTHGEDVLHWIETHRPELLPRCVVLSSAPVQQLAQVRAQWPSVFIVRKPFELRDVTDVAQQIVEGRGPRIETITGQYCRRSVAAGAKASVVVQLRETDIALVTAFGYKPGVAESYFPLSIDAPLPICTAIRKAAPVWLASVTVAAPEYPLLVAVWRENES
ncbi:MAG: response regulator, partial [Thermoanaerobaculia bacterium]